MDSAKGTVVNSVIVMPVLTATLLIEFTNARSVAHLRLPGLRLLVVFSQPCLGGPLCCALLHLPPEMEVGGSQVQA